MKYLKVFTDFAENIEPLNDTEVGRLFRAMLLYAKAGTESDLRGNERFLWNTAKMNIDNQREKYKNRCEVNSRIATNRYESLREATKKHESCQDKEYIYKLDNTQNIQPLQNEDTSCSPSFGVSSDELTPSNNNQEIPGNNGKKKIEQEDRENKGVRGKRGESGEGKKRTPKLFDHDGFAYKLAEYLDKSICKAMPTVKPSDEHILQQWADAFDKCNRLDGHDWIEIRDVLIFARKDAFWQKNILSGEKFRKQYIRLLAAKNGVHATAKNGGNVFAELLREEQVESEAIDVDTF